MPAPDSARLHGSTDPDAAREEQRSRRLDRAFRVSVTLKGLDGALETAGGVLLLFLSPRSIVRFVRWLTLEELAESPHDFIARHLLHSASQLTATTTLYGAVYLLAHGTAKVVLVVLVLRNKLWAYPWMIALLIAFMAYQTYEIAHRPTLGLAGLTVFDGLVAWLTWREYRAKHAGLHVSQPPSVT